MNEGSAEAADPGALREGASLSAPGGKSKKPGSVQAPQPGPIWCSGDNVPLEAAESRLKRLGGNPRRRSTEGGGETVRKPFQDEPRERCFLHPEPGGKTTTRAKALRLRSPDRPTDSRQGISLPCVPTPRCRVARYSATLVRDRPP